MKKQYEYRTFLVQVKDMTRVLNEFGAEGYVLTLAVVYDLDHYRIFMSREISIGPSN